MARPKKIVKDAVKAQVKPQTQTEPQAEKPAPVQTASGSDMVTVAYNSPRGILFTLGNNTVHINGNASHLIRKEMGIIPVGKYGYTRITRAEWEAIQKTYGSMQIFKSGLIFAEASKSNAVDRAEEQKELRHGLEPVDVKAEGVTSPSTVKPV